MSTTSNLVRRKLIQGILDGEYKVNEPLAAERELAELFQVGRPTIREVLKGLEKEGWIRIRKGMPAIINDYWRYGNLMTIVTILQFYEDIPDVFIEYMLELRVSLAPTIVREAAIHQRIKAIAIFSELDDLKDEADSYAAFDWQVQQSLAQLSPNPIYLLILNSFTTIYVPMATKYFSNTLSRSASRKYYEDLLASFLSGNVTLSEELTKDVMKRSLQSWKLKNIEGDGKHES